MTLRGLKIAKSATKRCRQTCNKQRIRREARWQVWRPPVPGPCPSGDQGINLACLPAQNTRPSHSPSTWARPHVPPRRPGLVLAHRYVTSSPHPTGQARMRVENYLRAAASCAARERQVARPVSRLGFAAEETADARKCGARRHLPSCGSEHQRTPALQGDTSSLPGRRFTCRFFLFRWHRAQPHPKFQGSDLRRPRA